MVINIEKRFFFCLMITENIFFDILIDQLKTLFAYLISKSSQLKRIIYDFSVCFTSHIR